MKLLWTSVLAMWIASAPILVADDEMLKDVPPAPDPVSVEVGPDVKFSLELGSRLYPDWSDTVEVPIGERFYLGDSEYTAELRRFMPDMRMKGGEAINVSLELNNPAVEVMLYSGDAVADSSWAFLNFPPHFSADEFFTFQLKRIHGYPGTEGR